MVHEMKAGLGPHFGTFPIERVNIINNEKYSEIYRRQTSHSDDISYLYILLEFLVNIEENTYKKYLIGLTTCENQHAPHPQKN